MNKRIVQAVKCESCGEIHEVGTKTYITVQGNILIGEDGGIVDNNIIDGKVVNESIYCIKCFSSLVQASTGIVYREALR
jgi:hypothetical protein